jgi:hypothetical protein
MGLSFVTRKYICNNCNNSGTVYSAIKHTSDILLYFTAESRPAEVSENKIYYEILERDSFGMVSKRAAAEIVCEHCQSSDYTPETVQKFDNVLNFYPPCEASKWYNGFNK